MMQDFTHRTGHIARYAARYAARLFSGLLVAAMPVAALAQFAGTGGGDIELYADDAVSVNGVTTLTGQVDARQGNVRILANTMVIYAGNRGTASSVGTVADDIDRIIATGEFYYITPNQEVRGDKGVYTASNDTFEVTGNVVLVQDESVVRGTRLIYELSNQRARIVSDCEGRKCGRQNRVAILIKNRNPADPAS